MSCAVPELDADKWLALADRIPVLHQPFDDLGRPGSGNLALTAAGDDGAEITGERDDAAFGPAAGGTERPRRRRDDQPPLGLVAGERVAVGHRLRKMLLDHGPPGVELITRLDRG